MISTTRGPRSVSWRSGPGGKKEASGKLKLSDKWEPVMYTAVASKPALHIYRIRDCYGNECRVHLTCLLDVNFSPVGTTLDGNASCLADSVVRVPSVSDQHGTEGFGEASSAVPAEPSLPDSLYCSDKDDRTAPCWPAS